MATNPKESGSGTALTSNLHLARVDCWPKSTSARNNVHDAPGSVPFKDPNNEFGEVVCERVVRLELHALGAHLTVSCPSALKKLGLSKWRKCVSLSAVN